MQYQVTRGEKGKVEIRVDVAKAAFEQSYNQTLGKFSQDANIAGFRPGKAPPAVVEGKVGLNKILNETASSLISKHLSDILEKEKLIPLESPKIAVNTLAKSSPFSFTASFTEKPKVKVGNWKTIRVKKVAAREITEKEINESIENIYEAWVKKSKVESQKSKVEEKEEPETSDQKLGTKFIYDAHGKKVFFEERKTMRSSSDQDSTAGLKIFPKDEESKSESKVESGGPSTNVQDEIDDNFAKAIGARDLSHLQEIVKKDLETLVADQVEAKLENEIFDKMIELGTIEVPDILIDDELNRILIRLNSELERQQKKLDDYLAEQNTTLDALKAKWRPQAEKNVRISLILEQIGRDEKIQVSREEVEQATKGVNVTNLTEDQKKDLERYLAVSIFQAKTLDLVKKTIAT